MAIACWNKAVIAHSDDYETVEGNIYFPPNSIEPGYLNDNETRSHCPWKGEAHYYNITINGETLCDGAWSYPAPKDAAANIKNYVAFGNGVVVSN